MDNKLAKCVRQKSAKYLLPWTGGRRNELFAKKRGWEKLRGWSRLSKRTRRRRGITSTREVREKICWIDEAIQKTGDHSAPSGLGMKPYFGSTIVALDLEYIDSVQIGAMTSGM